MKNLTRNAAFALSAIALVGLASPAVACDKGAKSEGQTTTNTTDAAKKQTPEAQKAENKAGTAKNTKPNT